VIVQSTTGLLIVAISATENYWQDITLAETNDVAKTEHSQYVKEFNGV
jgi:hypothetical protein